MKFTVPLFALKKAVAFVVKLVKNNPAVPVLENIHCTLQDGTLTLRTTDLQTTLKMEITVDAKEAGVFLVPAKMLSDILNNLAEQPVTISADPENFRVTVKHATGTQKIPGENPVDFPKPTTVGRADSIVLDGEGIDSFVAGIEAVSFAASDDGLKPAMTGINLHRSPAGKLAMVATNGHMLSLYPSKADAPEYPLSAIIPGPFAGLIASGIKTAGDFEQMTLLISQSNMEIQYGPCSMICRLIDDRYPDFENAIPASFTKKAVFKKTELTAALKRVLLTANPVNMRVHLTCREGKPAAVFSEDMDLGQESRDELSADYTGDDIEIAFSGKMLLSGLSKITGDEVTLNMTAHNRPAIVTGSVEGAKFLIMPQLPGMY